MREDLKLLLLFWFLLVDDIDHWCVGFYKALDDIDALLTENRIFKQRNVDIGVVPLDEAFAWAFRA